jgi:protease II
MHLEVHHVCHGSKLAGALLASQALNKVPGVFAAALLRRPFVTLLNSMTDPDLPMTKHEYDEWGDPGDEDVVKMWAHLSPHKQIMHARCASALALVQCTLLRCGVALSRVQQAGVLSPEVRTQDGVHGDKLATRT